MLFFKGQQKNKDVELLRLAVIGLVVVGAVWLLNQTDFGLVGAKKTVNDKLLTEAMQNERWSGLTRYGDLPIVLGEMGRPNPFSPGQVSPETAEGRDAIRVRDMVRFSTALGWHFKDFGKYPVGQNVVLGSEVAVCLTSNGWASAGGCGAADRRYLDPAPADPGGRFYSYISNGSSYTIKVELEASKGTLSSWEYHVGP